MQGQHRCQILYNIFFIVTFEKEILSIGLTPEEMAQLPSWLPEGLGGVGMGLCCGGNPLTEVANKMRGRGSNNVRFGPSYGLSPQFLENLGIDGPLHTR